MSEEEIKEDAGYYWSEARTLAPVSDMSLEAIRQADVANIMWKTREDGLVRLCDMADSHLRNAALMLMGMGYQRYRASDEIKIKWLTVFAMEWKRRHPELG